MQYIVVFGDYSGTKVRNSPQKLEKDRIWKCQKKPIKSLFLTVGERTEKVGGSFVMRRSPVRIRLGAEGIDRQKTGGLFYCLKR